MSVKKAPMNVYRSRTFGMLAACVGILLSSPAHALSLGGFQVRSALDEPLRAEITLQSVDSETLESLEVKLGSSEDFQRAAVPRSDFLQQLEFTVSAEGDEAVVVVTTEQPVSEPFLHFLIAAEWSGGKLVREYTGLLDPPLYAAETPSSVEAPATGEAPRPEVSSTEARPEPADPEAGSPSPSSTELSGAPGRSAEYGPTLAGDTLWDIASRLQTGSLQVNVFQIMIALLRENPDAFVDNNINRLKTDQILRLPDLGSIADVPAVEAGALYTAQLEEWQAYKTRLADAGVDDEVEIAGDAASTAMATEETVAEAAPAEAAGEGNSGQDVEAGREAGQGADQGAEQDDVLRIVQATLDETQQSETAGAGSDRSAEVAELRGQIATLEESLESRTLANEELRERVRLLESQLENAQRLIQIESEELAAAQQQAAERQATAEESMPEESVAGALDEARAGEESANQTGTAPEAETDASQAGAVSTTAGGEEARTQETQTTQQAAAAAPASQGASEASQGDGITRVVNRPPRTSWWSSIPDLLFSSWMWMVGAGAGVLVLVLGLLMFLRRRQSIAEFEESILSGKGLDSYSETTDTAGASASDTSFLSDFGTAGMGTMQADEVDPLAEAEVYLAYGRDEQAEEVLKEAARRDPDRSEIKLKLLEIYKQRNDVKSFETIAEELYPASEQEDPEIWRRVNAMGRELNPDNPLFQESEEPGGATAAPAATAATAATAPGAAGVVDDLNFDLEDSGPEQAPTTAGAGSSIELEEQSTGELGMDMEPEPDTTPAPPAETGQSSTGSDEVLDLGDEFLERSTRNVDPSTQPFPAPDQQADLDRELERLASERETATAQLASGGESEPGTGDDTPSHEVAWETAQTDSPTLDFPASDTSEIDFNLNLDESSIPSEPGMESQPADEKSADEQSEPLDTGEGLLEFESEHIPPQETWAGPSSDASPGDEESLSYSPDDDVQSTGAPQYNEAETKLDLARAYLDMGDKVGARSIIDEVMREGDPAQRDRAAELASQL